MEVEQVKVREKATGETRYIARDLADHPVLGKGFDKIAEGQKARGTNSRRGRDDEGK